MMAKSLHPKETIYDMDYQYRKRFYKTAINFGLIALAVGLGLVIYFMVLG